MVVTTAIMLLILQFNAVNGFQSSFLHLHSNVKKAIHPSNHNDFNGNLFMFSSDSSSEHDEGGEYTQHQPKHQQQNRRQMLQKSASAVLLPLATISQTAFITLPNDVANAAVDTSLLDTQAGKFKRVPLFAIVNGKTGTPFMILQNTGKAQAYFFTTYEGALAVLDDAKRDAADKGAETKDMWDEAKISAVNLEFALKLGKGRPKALAQNNVKYDTVYDVIPSIKSINEAEKIDKSGMYSERGRVPLFYSDEFEIGPEKEGGPNRIPIFFEKDDLVREFSKKFPDREEFVVTVVDLMDIFATLMGSKPIGAKVDERIVDKLYVVGSPDSRRKAVDLEKARGSVPAYKTGEMIAVGGK